MSRCCRQRRDVTWRTDKTIPVDFGTIRVVPAWRFLLGDGAVKLLGRDLVGEAGGTA